MPEREKSEIHQVTPQEISADLTFLIHSSIPDKFPTKESRIGKDKVEDYFSVIYSPIDPKTEAVPVRIDRETYPRKNNEGSLLEDSLMDRSYVIWLGDSKPYFLRESGLMLDGVSCDDRQIQEVYSKIQELRKGLDEGSIDILPHRYDNDIQSKTLGKLVPIFESS